MRTYKVYNTATEQPASKTECGCYSKRTIPDNATITNPSYRQPNEGFVWAELVDAPPLEIGEDEVRSPLPNVLDKSQAVWVLTRNITEAVPYVQPVPTQVTRGQFIVEMIKQGIKTPVETIVATQSEEVQAWYANALHFLRDNSTIEAVNVALGAGAVDLDDFFIAASKNAP